MKAWGSYLYLNVTTSQPNDWKDVSWECYVRLLRGLSVYKESWPVLWIKIDVISFQSTRFIYPAVLSSQVSLPTVSRPLQANMIFIYSTGIASEKLIYSSRAN